MSNLLQEVLEAHGGLERWNALTEITAHVSIGGTVWGRKGHEGILADTHVRIDPHQERTGYEPFGAPGRRSVFTPSHNRIEAVDGTVLAERDNPRAAFSGHTGESLWDELNVVYFSGYAMWNYLTIPFLLAQPGFVLREIEPWRQDGQQWRRLVADFPDRIATHNRTQTFYFDESGLLRRHDYAADVFGGLPSAHYTDEHKVFGGISFPTRRRVVPRLPDGTTLAEPVVVAIDVHDVTVAG